MRKVKLYIATSLDAKIARKNGAIDWLPQLSDEDYGYKNFLSSIDTTLMGYKTYEICLSFGEWVYKDQKNYVFSRNPSKPCISEAELISSDPVEFVNQLKNQPGKDIWLIGGGEINTLLHDAGLIDEYIVAYIPLVLGEGVELLPNVKRQQNMKLTKHEVYPNGVVLLYLEKE